MTSLVAVGVVPSTPLLVPAVAGGAVAELAALREAVGSVLQGIVAAFPEHILVATCGDQPALTSFGLPGVEGLPVDVVDWLGRQLRASGYQGLIERRVLPPATAAVPPSLDVPAGHSRTALLLVGDASIRHRTGGPGGFHEDAADFDEQLVTLLSGPVAGLTELHVEWARQQSATLGSLLALPAAVAAAGADTAELLGACLHYEAPYGVGYLAALLVSPRRDA